MQASINTAEGKTLAKVLYRTVFDYFQNEDNRRAFKKWYKKTYGREHIEKKGDCNVKPN